MIILVLRNWISGQRVRRLLIFFNIYAQMTLTSLSVRIIRNEFLNLKFKMTHIINEMNSSVSKFFFFLGTILNTGMHNKEGGYENDCSITRLAYNRFMLMSPSIQQMRSFTWVKHHLPDDGSVYLQVRM